MSPRVSGSFRCVLIGAILILTGCWRAFARITASDDPQYILDRWETTDGLPENSATSIVQMPDGYLWFGTFNGLVRFDGIRCVVFDPSTTPELPSAEIVNLFLDRSGGLWVSTTAGLARLYNGAWTRLTPAKGWVGNYVRSFAERANGDLLLTTFDGHILESVNGHFREMKRPAGDEGAGYFGICEGDQWWVVQNKFVGSWDGTNWETRVDIGAVDADKVGAVPARGEGFWILAGRELRKIRGGKEIERRTLPAVPGGFWSLMEDRSENVWICTLDKGVTRVAKNGRTKHWGATEGLAEDSARVAYEDREENIWVGTSGAGLVRFKTKRFFTFGPESGIAEGNIKTIAQDASGQILFGTFGGGLYGLDERGARKLETPWELEGRIGKYYMQSLFVDSQSRIWLGAFERGLSQFDGAAHRIFSVQQTGRNVIAIFEDSQKRVWVGGEEGVGLYDNLGFAAFSEASGLSGQHFRAFGEDTAGNLWTASSEGVFRLNGESFREIKAPEDGSIREVTSFLSATNGGMWMGTKTVGLVFWKDGRVIRIGDAAGLHVKTVTGMVDDSLGYFWLATNRGIVRVSRTELEEVIAGNRKEANFIQLGLGDGLRTLECSGGQQPVCIRDREGRLWFATLRGAAMIDPKSFRIDAEPPRLYIEDASFSDAGGARRHFAPDAPFRIPPGSTRFEARLAGLSYRSPEDVTYYYRLKRGGQVVIEDYQKGNILTSERMPAGDYQLEVAASNGDGVRTRRDAVMGFTVQAYYWETAWFRLGAVAGSILAVAGVTWASTWVRVRREMDQLRHRQTMAALQLRADEALRESEERYRAVVEFSPIGVVVSVDELVVFLNRAAMEMVGAKNAGQILGHSILEFMHPDEQEEARERRRRAIEERIASPARESKILRLDGSVGAVEGFAVPFSFGGKAAVLIFIVDVTDRKKAQTEKQRMEIEFREIAGRLMRIQDEERRRIGRELHDSTGQSLAALEINLGMLARQLTQPGLKIEALLDECMELAGQCTGEIRTTSYLLHPPLLDEVGLASALRWYADGFRKRSGIDVRLDLPESARRFPAETELALFRVVQEAFTNIHRHSSSATASIRLVISDSQIELEVVDEGRGIGAEHLQLFREGHSNLGVGISGMRERIRQLGGELSVESEGRGTRVRVRLPIDGTMEARP